MIVEGTVALVTGANRGIGRAHVEALVEAGVRRVYAAARTLETLKDVVAIAPEKIVPIALDVTDADRVNLVARTAGDTEILINNAGVLGSGGLFTTGSVETARWEMNTNYFGTLNMVRAFAPILENNGGGAIVNMLSMASIANVPIFSSNSASKAALYSLTQGVRAELAARGTLVIGVFPGPVDTAMAEQIPLDKIAPLEVAKATIRALEQGTEEVYPDAISQNLFANLQAPLKEVEKQFSTMLPG